MGELEYAYRDLWDEPLELFRDDSCGHSGGTPRRAEICHQVYQQHGQQYGGKRSHSNDGLLFLLSEYEVFGSTTYANSNEASKQAQYAYYSAGNSKIKYKHNATSTAAFWWLRSPSAGYSSSFVYVGTGGTVNYDIAGYSRGFAPGFCV